MLLTADWSGAVLLLHAPTPGCIPGTWLPHRNRSRRTQPPAPGTWTEFPAPESYAKSEHRPARRLTIEATVRL
jgi:hypothetical protein